MTTGEFDKEDIAPWGAVLLGAASMTGIGTFSLYGYALSDTAYTIGGYALSWDLLMFLGGALAIFITNEVDFGDLLNGMADGTDPTSRGRKELETLSRIALVAVIAVPLGMLFVTQFSDFVTGSDIAGTAAAALSAGGAAVGAYGG